MLPNLHIPDRVADLMASLARETREEVKHDSIR